MATSRGSTPVRSEEHNSYFQAGYIKRCQYKDFTASVGNSGIIDDETSLVRLFATQDCWVSVIASGATQPTKPGASTQIVENIQFLPGGIVDFIGIPPNVTSPVISVVSNGTNGILHIVEYV